MKRSRTRKDNARAWQPTVDRVVLPKDAHSAGYANAREALRRLVDLLGNNQVGAILGVAKTQPPRWLRREPMSSEYERRILDLDYLISRALRVIHSDKIGAWLTYKVPTLGWARPVDVLATEGPEAVVRALDVIEEGALL